MYCYHQVRDVPKMIVERENRNGPIGVVQRSPDRPPLPGMSIQSTYDGPVVGVHDTTINERIRGIVAGDTNTTIILGAGGPVEQVAALAGTATQRGQINEGVLA